MRTPRMQDRICVACPTFDTLCNTFLGSTEARVKRLTRSVKRLTRSVIRFWARARCGLLFRQMISANNFGIICRNNLPGAHPSPEADGQMISTNNSEIICRNHLPRTRAQKLILGSIKSGPASGFFFSKFSGACGGLCFL